MKNIILIMFLFYYEYSYSQITYISDVNFEQKLINLGFDSDNTINGQVITSDIENLTYLDMNNSNIYDFSGIENFYSLEILILSNNFFDTLDLSNNFNLREIYSEFNINLTNFILPNSIIVIDISESPISDINFGDLTQLEFLNLSYNRVQMSSLDLSNCTNLMTLNCINLGIESIDLVNNTNLITLYCGNDPTVDWAPIAYNELTSINLSYNINLKDLMLVSLPLEELNLTFNPDIENVYSYFCSELSDIVLNNNNKLKYLDVNKCSLTEIDLEEIPNIETLRLGTTLQFFDDSYSRNKINHLDFENSKDLKKLYVEDIELHTLTLKNGNNDSLQSVNMKSNPDLYCVQVDNEKAANNEIGVYSNWLKDSFISYSENCSTVAIENESFLDFNVYPNPTKGLLNLNIDKDSIEKLELYNSIGKKVEIKSIAQDETILINLNQLSKGIYYFKLTDKYNNFLSKSILLE